MFCPFCESEDSDCLLYTSILQQLEQEDPLLANQCHYIWTVSYTHLLGMAGRIFASNVVCLLIRLLFVFFAIPVIGMQGYLWGILVSQLVLAGIYFFCLYHFFRKN